jgi:hypothetical protein
MRIRNAIAALVCILFASGCVTREAKFGAAPETVPPRKPNIILIVADDLSQLDLSTYGRSPKSIPTPNLDRLAKRGVTFKRGYSTASVCSPSRAALMTGQYQQRHGFEFLTPEGPDAGGQGLAPEQRVFAADLKAAGYRTAAFAFHGAPFLAGMVGIEVGMGVVLIIASRVLGRGPEGSG